MMLPRWFVTLLFVLALATPAAAAKVETKPSQELARHLSAIAALAKPSPMLPVPEIGRAHV